MEEAQTDNLYSLVVLNGLWLILYVSVLQTDLGSN